MTDTQWRDLLASGGVLSADGKIWWPDRDEMNNDHLRPFMVSLADCRRILIQGITLRNSPKFVFCPSHCSNLTLDHAHIFNEWWAQNGNGMDISACKRVIIYACTVNAGDDGIYIKSSGADPNGPALQDVIVAGCTVYRDFYISRIDCQGAATAISITGLPQMPITDISFDSVTISATKGLVATQARNIRLHEVKLDTAEKPVYQTDRTAEIRIN